MQISDTNFLFKYMTEIDCRVGRCKNLTQFLVQYKEASINSLYFKKRIPHCNT